MLTALDHPPPRYEESSKRHAEATAKDEPEVECEPAAGEQVAEDQEERERAEGVARQAHEGNPGAWGEDGEKRDQEGVDREARRQNAEAHSDEDEQEHKKRKAHRIVGLQYLDASAGI